MKRICLHWTAGGPKATPFDRQFYHRLVNQDGHITLGLYRPEANIPPLRPGHYAAHLGGGNSNTIGWAVCGMAGFKNSRQVGSFPLTQIQCEAAFKGMAQDARLYRIPIEPETVFTHYEFGKANPDTVSHGKIDIIYLPFEPTIKAGEIGDYMRNKVQWYFDKLRI